MHPGLHPGKDRDKAQGFPKDRDWTRCRIWELLYLRHSQGIEGKDKTVKFKEEKYLGLGGGGRGCGQIDGLGR